jgi:hypothetical protein
VPLSASSAISARLAIRANSHARSRYKRSGRRPPIGLAAVLPLSAGQPDLPKVGKGVDNDIVNHEIIIPRKEHDFLVSTL